MISDKFELMQAKLQAVPVHHFLRSFGMEPLLLTLAPLITVQASLASPVWLFCEHAELLVCASMNRRLPLNNNCSIS